jgi:type IV secretory pathway VirB4 component
VNAIEAWLGSLPGHVYANVRQPPVSTLNLAHMMPLSAVWAGPERDYHFDAPALVPCPDGRLDALPILAPCRGCRPHIDHWADRRKSVLLALMALQFRRYAGAQIFAFDSGGGARHGRRLA